jgi:hypothetical protein
MADLYLRLYTHETRENVDSKLLWRWIKSIVKQSKSNERQYTYFWDELMKEYNLSSMSELQEFVRSLLEKNRNNQRNVEKIKKLLMVGKINFIL